MRFRCVSFHRWLGGDPYGGEGDPCFSSTLTPTPHLTLVLGICTACLCFSLTLLLCTCLLINLSLPLSRFSFFYITIYSSFFTISLYCNLIPSLHFTSQRQGKGLGITQHHRCRWLAGWLRRTVQSLPVQSRKTKVAGGLERTEESNVNTEIPSHPPLTLAFSPPPFFQNTVTPVTIDISSDLFTTIPAS